MDNCFNYALQSGVYAQPLNTSMRNLLIMDTTPQALKGRHITAQGDERQRGALG